MVIQTVKMKDIRFIELFCKDNKEKTDIEELISIMNANGSIKYADEECKRYGNTALDELRKLPASQARVDL